MSAAYSLIKFFGLRRSGNHAVLNWLLGQDPESMLFFNQVQPGTKLLEKPFPITLPAGVRAYSAKDSNGQKHVYPEYVEELNNNGGCVVCSFEDKDLRKYDRELYNANIVECFGFPAKENNVMILRNPVHMLPSTVVFLKRVGIFDGMDMKLLESRLARKARLWKTYAMLHLQPKSMPGEEFVSIVFEQWLTSKTYRDDVAAQLGYVNKDMNLEFVSGAGGGSSFGRRGRATPQMLTNRWNDAPHKDVIAKVLRKDPELLELTERIYGKDEIPDDLLRFAT